MSIANHNNRDRRRLPPYSPPSPPSSPPSPPRLAGVSTPSRRTTQPPVDSNLEEEEAVEVADAKRLQLDLLLLAHRLTDTAAGLMDGQATVTESRRSPGSPSRCGTPLSDPHWCFSFTTGVPPYLTLIGVFLTQLCVVHVKSGRSATKELTVELFMNKRARIFNSCTLNSKVKQWSIMIMTK
jgi:hypothetical protein